jgi:hypothetical protein
MTIVESASVIVTCDDCEKEVTYIGRDRHGAMANAIKAGWQIDASKGDLCKECR